MKICKNIIEAHKILQSYGIQVKYCTLVSQISKGKEPLEYLIPNQTQTWWHIRVRKMDGRIALDFRSVADFHNLKNYEYNPPIPKPICNNMVGYIPKTN